GPLNGVGRSQILALWARTFGLRSVLLFRSSSPWHARIQGNAAAGRRFYPSLAPGLEFRTKQDRPPRLTSLSLRRTQDDSHYPARFDITRCSVASSAQSKHGDVRFLQLLR